MEFADWDDVNELATKQSGKFSVYVSNQLKFDDTDTHVWSFVVSELIKIFGMASKEYYDCVGNLLSGGLFFFDSEEKAHIFYDIFDKELTYSSAIYAAIYSPIDGSMTENT